MSLVLEHLSSTGKCICKHCNIYNTYAFYVIYLLHIQSSVSNINTGISVSNFGGFHYLKKF